VIKYSIYEDVLLIIEETTKSSLYNQNGFPMSLKGSASSKYLIPLILIYIDYWEVQVLCTEWRR